jgi:hypothetical protein
MSKQCRYCNSQFPSDSKRRVCDDCLNDHDAEKHSSAMARERRKFAAMMLQGILASGASGEKMIKVESAIMFADELLLQLSKEKS